MPLVTRLVRPLIACAVAAQYVALPLESLAAQTATRGSAAPVENILAPGVRYQQLRDPRGPWLVHVVRVDLRRAAVDVRAARAHDQLRSREKTTDMVQRAVTGGATVLAAVNSDFFELKSGENENNQIIDGEWWKGVKVTDSPYDTYDNVHAQFGLDATGRPVLDRFIFDGKAWAHGTMVPIISINANPTGNPEGSALFTPRYGATTPRDTARPTVEVALQTAGRRGDTLLYRRQGSLSTVSGSAIPSDGAILSAYGARAKALESMADGDTVRVLLSTFPRPSRGVAPRTLIGGWPRILRNGVNVAADAATMEGTISRNAEARHPRTAVGFSRDSSTLFLLTVDGRSAQSVGMTIVELAEHMRQMGAWNALNFDGGGSTTMVIDGRVVNTPSDPTGEREVGNALLIVKRPTGRK